VLAQDGAAQVQVDGVVVEQQDVDVGERTSSRPLGDGWLGLH
jgi:hypothetical protein